MYFEMFKAFFKIGAFTIGGGYAMVPLIQDEVVEKKEWLSDEEFVDIMAIAEITPGPVAVNTSTYVGYKLKGVKGSIVCTLSTVLPSFLIILLIVTSLWKYRNNAIIEKAFLGIRPAVAALVFSAVYKIGKGMNVNKYMLAIGLITVLAVVVFNVSPIIIILVVAFGSIGYYKNREKK